MTNINKSNLPVLYSVPKWKLKLVIPNRKRKLYYLPELDEYVDSTHVTYKLVKLGKTPQEWYDRWNLNITTHSDRPRLSNGKLARFRDICFGYATTQEEDKPDIQFSDWIKIWNDKRSKASCNSTKGQLNRYKNPEERKKTGRLSAKAWSNLTEKLLNNSLGGRHKNISKVYSIWEKKLVTVDSSWEAGFINKLSKLNVSNLIRSPFAVKYINPYDNEMHNYIPDFLLNDRYLIEIKPNYLIHDPVNQAKFHAASIYCSDHNLSYVIVTEDYLFHNGSPYYGSLPFKLNDHATTND